MGNEKEYTFTFNPETFDPLEASPAEELFSEDDLYEGLVFEAGITEAVKRLLKKHNDYDIIKFVRSILDVEYEGEKKDE